MFKHASFYICLNYLDNGLTCTQRPVYNYVTWCKSTSEIRVEKNRGKGRRRKWKLWMICGHVEYMKIWLGIGKDTSNWFPLRGIRTKIKQMQMEWRNMYYKSQPCVSYMKLFFNLNIILHSLIGLLCLLLNNRFRFFS